MITLCELFYTEQTEVETPPSPKGHQRSQSDGPVMLHNDDSCDSKKDTDKKTVKNLLSQLLPTNTNLLQIPVSPEILFQSNFSTN